MLFIRLYPNHPTYNYIQINKEKYGRQGDPQILQLPCGGNIFGRRIHLLYIRLNNTIICTIIQCTLFLMQYYNATILNSSVGVLCFAGNILCMDNTTIQ